MKITTVLFDLDGTLLPMDQERFIKGYFTRLTQKMAPRGYDSEAVIRSIWLGTEAMVKNDGSRTNEQAFLGVFREKLGEKILEDLSLLDDFYRVEFQDVRGDCGFDPRAADTVRKIKALGYRVALATNPLFPSVATESRIRWAGLEPDEFACYTVYENSTHCKPHPAYYLDIAKALSVSPEECLMVGNDVGEDMLAASSVGMRVFLLTDCLINQTDRQIEDFPNGSFPELMKFIKSL